MPRIITRKLLMKFLTLAVLGLGLAIVESDRAARAGAATDCMTCDENFPVCNAGCGNDGPCYGECLDAYAQCLYACNDDFSRTPILDPNAGCETNAERVRQYCLRGRVGRGYREIYENCMADGGDVGACCGQVGAAFYTTCIGG